MEITPAYSQMQNFTTDKISLHLFITVNDSRNFWIRETGTGQQVAQLHDRYMMMMMN